MGSASKKVYETLPQPIKQRFVLAVSISSMYSHAPHNDVSVNDGPRM